MDHVDLESASSTRLPADELRLVTEEKHTFIAPAQAVGEMGLRDWCRIFARPAQPCGEGASVDELREKNKRLRKQPKRADITYLPTVRGWVHLAVLLDLFSCKVVGWSIDESLATPLVSGALRQAIESRRLKGQQLLHHSGRRCQYTSDTYQQTLRTLGITCSMNRAGGCYDNAAMERFFWSLKHERSN